jgi:hypothetical protein
MACTAPLEPMPFTVRFPNGIVFLREGQCVIDPGWWMYVPRSPAHFYTL